MGIKKCPHKVKNDGIGIFVGIFCPHNVETTHTLKPKSLTDLSWMCVCRSSLHLHTFFYSSVLWRSLMDRRIGLRQNMNISECGSPVRTQMPLAPLTFRGRTDWIPPAKTQSSSTINPNIQWQAEESGRPSWSSSTLRLVFLKHHSSSIWDTSVHTHIYRQKNKRPSLPAADSQISRFPQMCVSLTKQLGCANRRNYVI